jgi:hypothetical protein
MRTVSFNGSMKEEAMAKDDNTADAEAFRRYQARAFLKQHGFVSTDGGRTYHARPRRTSPGGRPVVKPTNLRSDADAERFRRESRGEKFNMKNE